VLPFSPAATSPTRTLLFADGSSATPASPTTELRTLTASADEVAVGLVAGAADFVVAAGPSHRFRVSGGAVSVQTFGARFAFARFGDAAQVDVTEGTVRVSWPGGERSLGRGESGRFPPDSPPARAQAAEPMPRRPMHAHPAPPSWRDLAHDGDYDRAYQALSRADAKPLRDEPEELLLAADVERLSHHPAEAVAPLEKLLRDHRADPRAPLAAFTLGRVQLEELGRPREAAQAFADAEALKPGGPMEEDAVAREVEAWSRAGEAARARELAADYVRRFPEGRKLRSVRRFGGLE
jgi:transmembrane sensor